MPRVCYSIEEVKAEEKRQRAMIAAGNMRRLGGAAFAGVTLEWEKGSTGKGRTVWRWTSRANYYGGVWQSETDREAAWSKAQQKWNESEKRARR